MDPVVIVKGSKEAKRSFSHTFSLTQEQFDFVRARKDINWSATIRDALDKVIAAARKIPVKAPENSADAKGKGKVAK